MLLFFHAEFPKILMKYSLETIEKIVSSKYSRNKLVMSHVWCRSQGHKGPHTQANSISSSHV